VQLSTSLSKSQLFASYVYATSRLYLATRSSKLPKRTDQPQEGQTPWVSPTQPTVPQFPYETLVQCLSPVLEEGNLCPKDRDNVHHNR
jgi:hypothetical protein